jgi:hypothetical protein
MSWLTPSVSLEDEIEEGLCFMAAQNTKDRDGSVERELDSLRRRGIVVTPAVRSARQSAFMADGRRGYRPAMTESAFRAAMTRMAAVDPGRYLDSPGPCLLFTSPDVLDSADEPAAHGGCVQAQELHGQWSAAVARFGSRPDRVAVQLSDASHDILPEASPQVALEIGRWLAELTRRGSR